jgi:succinate dehydrogenase hydrophobic anchor subunit
MGRVRMQIIHMIAGVFIAGLLGAHMVRLHLTRMVGLEEDPVGWTAMIGRSTDVAWVGVYIALLAFALYHALFGLRGVILESTSSAKWERTINWLFIIIGIVVFGWGTYVPLALLNG